MLGLARFAILGGVAMVIVYGSLWFYLRAKRLEKLEAEWESLGYPFGREDFLQKHMAQFDQKRRRTLFGLVVVVPICLVTAIIYRANYT